MCGYVVIPGLLCNILIYLPVSSKLSPQMADCAKSQYRGSESMCPVKSLAEVVVVVVVVFVVVVGFFVLFCFVLFFSKKKKKQKHVFLTMISGLKKSIQTLKKILNPFKDNFFPVWISRGVIMITILGYSLAGIEENATSA